MALLNRFNARAVATIGGCKYNDGAGLLLQIRGKYDTRNEHWL
ncbi:hypothetical protein ABID39_000782 [Bartonella japonica]|uniref:Uncharacterized protein n=1 Tax=Bartonella japonica TaxID=357761 RepID=A0ABV2FNL4_9HYPH